MSNEELAARIKAGINTADTMLILWRQNKGMIAKIALSYKGYEDIEDLEQQGYIGLCDAVEHYDTSAGVAFLTYAVYWIRQSMQRYIENNGSCIRLPAARLQMISRYKQFSRSFYQEYGRSPYRDEIKYNLELNDKEYDKLMDAVEKSEISSLNSPVQGLDDEQELVDTIADKTDMVDGIINRAISTQMKCDVWNVVDTLPENQPEVIRLRYQKGLTRKAIGELCGVGADKIVTIENKALAELRKPSRRRKLEPYAEDMISSHAYHGSGVSLFRHTWTSSTEYGALKLVQS